ncbi:MAG: hypothetical protein ABUL61_04860 [Oleiharenicola lentus]
MNRLTEITRLLSIGSWGLFAGAMLTEGFVLVAWWRSIPAAQFLQWYTQNDQRLLGFFTPLTIMTALLALVAAALALWTGHPGRWLNLCSAGLALLVVATFYLYFQKANAGFSTGRLGELQLAVELKRWATWHWGRTALSLAALAAAILAR